jgi:hypothetical protein
MRSKTRAALRACGLASEIRGRRGGRGGAGARRFVSASNQSTFGLRDETSNSSIAVRDGAFQRSSRTPRDKPLPKVLCRVSIGSVRVGALSIESRHPQRTRHRSVCCFGFPGYRRRAYREFGGACSLEQGALCRHFPANRDFNRVIGQVSGPLPRFPFA